MDQNRTNNNGQDKIKTEICDVEINKVCDVTEVIEKFGKYQIIQYLFACLPAIFITMVNVNFIFVAGDVNYRCKVPGCDVGAAPALAPPWWPAGTDRCARPLLAHNTSCDRFTGHVAPCAEWLYESNDSMIAELDLACQPWKINLLGTVHNAGMLLAMVIAGWLADSFGRKPAVVLCAVSATVGHLKAFASRYYMYAAVELLEAVSGGTSVGCMLIMAEIGGKKNLVIAGVVYAWSVYFGEAMFALIAMMVPNWKNLIRIIYTPPLFFLLYIFLLRESPRWQILNGKTEAAKETIRIIARMNKMKISQDDLNYMDQEKLREKFNIQSYAKKDSFLEIFKSKEMLTRLFVASSCRFSASFVYYGLMVNSVWLPGNKYTNFMLTALMSFPGELLALCVINRIGRKLPLTVGFLVSGALCVIAGYVPDKFLWVKIAVYLGGKMMIALCFTAAVSYSMELFPTSARGTLLGMCAFASRAGGMLAPLTPMLTGIFTALPTIFFGGSAILSSIVLSLTPETRDLPLMDTIAQVEAAAKSLREKKEREDENKRRKKIQTTHM